MKLKVQDINTIKDELTKDSEYTLVMPGMFGVIVTLLKFNRASEQDYAQYKNVLHLYFTEKGKRKPSGVRLKYNDSFAIYEGWQDQSKVSDGFVSGGEGITRSKYASCDQRYFTEAIESLGEPLFLYNHREVQ